jgi:arylsulfatase A-like enzyme
MEGEEAFKRPNIILFLVDDLGWQDTSVPFHSEPTPFNRRYRTPNMEALASEGMKFVDAYAASPVCTPTRTSILTGQNPARTHITYWILHKDKDTSAKHPTLVPPPWNLNGLKQDDVTLPGLLRQGGYMTIHAGKAHFGSVGTSGSDPLNLGFDKNIAGHAAGAPASYLGVKNFSKKKDGRSVWDVPGLEAYHGKEIYLTEALTREAVRAMDRAVKKGKPFFLYMSHYAVHTPIEADPRYVDEYADLHPREAAYASMIEGMDASLGRLMENLEKHGIAEETWVIFFSDNGGLSAHGRGGDKNTHNAPLKSGKGSSYEGGIRVPMLVKGPAVAGKGLTCETPVISHDLFPTILALAGIAGPATYMDSVDGCDLSPLLQGGRSLGRRYPLVWHLPHQWGCAGPGISPFSAIREGSWKLIYYHADQHFELYNLDADISEMNDLARQEPERVRNMAAALGRYLIESGARMSLDRSTGEPMAFPGQKIASQDLQH